jgi:membrane-associated two-gene conflict system component 1 (EACC1)
MGGTQLRLTGSDDPADTRELEAFLTGNPELRRWVTAQVAAPKPGAMGSVTDVLVVALGQGGTATALASVLISWIRRQRSTISVHTRCSCGKETTVSADHIQKLTAAQLREQVADLAGRLHCHRGER